MNKNLIGIIIPTVRPRFIAKAIQQVLDQSYGDYLLFVVSDGINSKISKIFYNHCKDNTKAHFLELEKRSNDWGATPRLKALERFKEMDLSPSYVVFWDDDNYFRKDALKEINEKLNLHSKQDFMLVPIGRSNRKVPPSGLSPKEIFEADRDTANYVTKLDLAHLAYSKVLENPVGIGEDILFFREIISNQSIRCVSAQMRSIGFYDGLRPFSSLRWRLGLPALNIRYSRWYQPINQFFRR